jgi:hypothetical protein
MALRDEHSRVRVDYFEILQDRPERKFMPLRDGTSAGKFAD